MAKKQSPKWLLSGLSLVGLYPNLSAYQFYFRPWNTFMPCKVLEAKEMLRGIDIMPRDIVLDIGCGDGALTLILGHRAKKVVGIDTKSKSIEKAKALASITSESIDAEFFLSKLEEASFSNEYFDKIFSFSVIEHIPNYIEVLEHAYRVLKPGGKMIISVDSLMGLSEERIARHRTTFDIAHYFSPSELRQLLEEIGFQVNEVYPFFSSEASKEWFMRVMDEPKESFNPLKSYITYFRLASAERAVKQPKEGLFTIAKCTKAETA